MNSPGVVRTGALEPQPAPNVLVSWGTTAPPTAPPKPRQFPRGTACTLEAAHREDSVHTRPALPLSSVPTPTDWERQMGSLWGLGGLLRPDVPYRA